ncbi:hypothetical protein FHP25_21980 [Vineibacter terrae]|uniref:Uncharacterized protein n=1 Tax=Vineibacter terrae TaxID=2586908 RepID=A0A5C8PI28_9HYPH|nr:hypothetical protein [Vineibacter terrae]TXL73349.1 hypothetical protein FHP25_21980 [Vineibacter terrae]
MTISSRKRQAFPSMLPSRTGSRRAAHGSLATASARERERTPPTIGPVLGIAPMPQSATADPAITEVLAVAGRIEIAQLAQSAQTESRRR